MNKDENFNEILQTSRLEPFTLVRDILVNWCVILLGALIKSMGLESLDWETMIRKTVKPQFAQLNLEAIRLGMQAYAE